MNEMTSIAQARYRVTGMDCGKCAAKIEGAARKIEGVSDVSVSITTGEMTVAAKESKLPDLEQAISRLGYHVDRLSASDDDETVLPEAHTNSAYRRALWIVIILNLGYGVAEMIGGLLAGSQALKADALDFLGDGAITLLGLMAIGWSKVRRAQSALLQGLFLAALGVGVLINTGYRVLVIEMPQAEIMGVMGAIALIINVVAAMALMPFRGGDANVRAVWLFSRNDAIGNFAVVVSAVLVAWIGSAWPDLLVATVIAGLFMHSAWRIIMDARRELARSKS
jgi:Co/Zn/Cd efflux system component